MPYVFLNILNFFVFYSHRECFNKNAKYFIVIFKLKKTVKKI